MRCNNCGWMNAEHERRCIKCNTELMGNGEPTNDQPARQVSKFSGTVPGTQTRTPAGGKEQASPDTKKENTDNINKTSPGEPTGSLITCPYPDCGYIYSAQASACPKCGRPYVKSVNATKTNPVTALSDTGNYTGTIDPYRNNDVQNNAACSLKPVDSTGESTDNPGQQKLFIFEDRPVELNRANLDPGNASITGKIQATLTYEDGNWYLEDKSELKTTFLAVNEKTALKEGDVIVMGNRKFIFSPVNSKS